MQHKMKWGIALALLALGAIMLSLSAPVNAEPIHAEKQPTNDVRVALTVPVI